MLIENSLSEEIALQTKTYLPQFIAIRRHLHAHPELSFEEWETAKFISEKLKEAGIEKQQRVAKTGIVALIEGRNPHKNCIALRADMDALPIHELNETPYKSRNEGVMHACGHDVHTTCLLSAASILQSLKDHFEGSIKLIFQPGEEKSPGGASLMIQEGVLENPKPSAIFGLHVAPTLPSGTIGFRSGTYMASADEIHIRIIGKGGHAAMPQLATDPIAIAAQIITGLQQLVSRKANPLTPTVLTFGKIAGGHATNIIPDEVILAGTLRTFDETWRSQAKQFIRSFATQTAEANGAKALIDFPPGYPMVFNNPELTLSAIKVATDFLGAPSIKALDLRMTAEDFAFYSQKIRACFFRLGTNKNNETYTTPVHQAHFDVDESAIETGVNMLCRLALNSL